MSDPGFWYRNKIAEELYSLNVNQLKAMREIVAQASKMDLDYFDGTYDFHLGVSKKDSNDNVEQPAQDAGDGTD